MEPNFQNFLWPLSQAFGPAHSPLNSATLICSSEVTLCSIQTFQPIKAASRRMTLHRRGGKRWSRLIMYLELPSFYFLEILYYRKCVHQERNIPKSVIFYHEGKTRKSSMTLRNQKKYIGSSQHCVVFIGVRKIFENLHQIFQAPRNCRLLHKPTNLFVVAVIFL